MKFHFADFVLDTGRQELRRGGERIALEPRTLALLVLLLERQGEAVGKDEILDALWPDTTTTESSLTRLVSLARAALGDRDREHPIIRTLYGRGYQIAVPVEVADAHDRTSDAGRPAIAVLPFQNLSSDPDQDHLAAGVTEDLIARLARRRHMAVVARTSVLAYRSHAGDVREVGRELGARYVMEGTVQRRGPSERVTVQLIEAKTGHHVWAHAYDRNHRDFFALQDEIVEDVVACLEPELRSFEISRASRPPTPDFAAWDHAMRGFWYLSRRTEADTRAAAACLDDALAIDDRCAMAHGGRALMRMLRLARGWDPDASGWKDALASARLAVDLDPGDPELRVILGDVLEQMGRFEEALHEHEQALALDPLAPMVHWGLARDLIGLERPAEALPRLEHALRVSPRDPLRPEYLVSLAWAQLTLGAFEASLDAARLSLGSREDVLPLCIAASACGHLRRHDEAKAMLERIRVQIPSFGRTMVQAYLTRRRFPASVCARLLEGLRLADVA